MSQQLGYSTDAVIVVDVTVIGIEVGIVVEIIQPRSPPHVIALNAVIHCHFIQTRKFAVTAVIIGLERVQTKGLMIESPQIVAPERVVQPTPYGALRQRENKKRV